MTTYRCFTRTWWKPNPAWPNGREPEAGKQRTKATGLSLAEAQAFCKEWNATHDPGPMSLKCEYDEE